MGSVPDCLDKIQELLLDGYSLSRIFRWPPNGGVSSRGPVNPGHRAPSNATGRPREHNSPMGPDNGAVRGGAPETMLRLANNPRIQLVGCSQLSQVSLEGPPGRVWEMVIGPMFGRFRAFV